MTIRSFYSEVQTRQASRFRLLKNLPLEDVVMGVPVALGDFGERSHWPPPRVQPRLRRLETYEELYRGNITNFVEDPTAANFVINFFERVPAVITSLMMSSDPEVADREEMRALQSMLGAGAINGFRSGRAYLVRIGDELWSPPTSSVFDGDEGEIYVLSTGISVTAQNAQPDYLDTWRIDGEGVMYWRSKYDANTIGAVIEGPVGIDGTYAIADRPPVFNGWGKSLLDSLIAPVAGLALRLSGAERIIEKNLHPITVYGLSATDISTLGSEGSPLVQSQAVDLAKFSQEVSDALDEDLLLKPESATVEKLEWGAAAMSAAEVMMAELTNYVSAMCGIPIDLLSGQFEAMSGVALDRLLLVLASETKQFTRVLHAAAEKVYGTEFEWPNYFEDQIETPAQPQPIVMLEQPETPATEEVNNG